MGDVPDPEDAVRDAIRHWSSLTALAEFAVRRHGYGNTDGGFGVIYPGDLDESDRVADGIHIPDGFVRVYGFWGLPDGYELLVPEAVYLKTLVAVLSAAGHAREAAQVQSLTEQQRPAEIPTAPDPPDPAT
jgi:hypothetical protein